MTPASLDACPGTNVSWVLEVCNEGICALSTVIVSDTLDAGLTYVGDDQGSAQGPTPQIRHWTFNDLAGGACVTIHLTASVNAPCSAAQLANNAGAEFERVHGLGQEFVRAGFAGKRGFGFCRIAQRQLQHRQRRFEPFSQ